VWLTLPVVRVCLLLLSAYMRNNWIKWRQQKLSQMYANKCLFKPHMKKFWRILYNGKASLLVVLCKKNYYQKSYFYTNFLTQNKSSGFYLYTVSKKTSPFLCLWYLCQISSDSANFWHNHAPGNLKQTHVHAQFISRFICSYCTLQKLATRQNAYSDVGHFLFVFSLNRNVVPSLKAYLNFWHYNLYQKIHELTYYLQKHEICIDFL